MPLTSVISDSNSQTPDPSEPIGPIGPNGAVLASANRESPDSATGNTKTADTKTAAAKETAAITAELERLFELVVDDFTAVNELIPRQLTSDVELVESIGRYIVESGGKRLRPLIVLLGARMCGVQGRDHIRLAAIIEFLHTATLLHDDVVDRSGLRRGRATANALWGNAPSVLVGDFLYSRAFQLMVELENLDIMAILADATNVIAEGEVLQLANIGNSELSEDSYREVIRCKTAMLFQAAAQAGAVLGCATAQEDTDTDAIDGLRDYGLHFGVAYQLVDDWLDYAGDAEVMGKNVGDDLAEGKATLPLIYTIANGSPADAALIRDALQSKCADKLDEVCAAVHRSGALDYTRAQAQAASTSAIEALLQLPANPYRDALEDLAHVAIARVS